MNLSVLCWNLNPEKADRSPSFPGANDPATVAASIVHERKIDLVVLLECPIAESTILAALRSATGDDFQVPESFDPGFRYFSRFPASRLVPSWVSPIFGRVSINRLVTDQHQDIILAVAHCVAAVGSDEYRQGLEAWKIRCEVESVERKAGHSRTILFGDFNMNPYHVGMLSPDVGFGAMMTWELAEAHARGEGGRPRFYNPMWAKMGSGPAPGTYYFSDSRDSKNPFWNCIDGVLVRPELRDFFSADEVFIIDGFDDESGERRSLTRLARKHYQLACSDHLPIAFRVDLPPVVPTPAGA